MRLERAAGRALSCVGRPSSSTSASTMRTGSPAASCQRRVKSRSVDSARTAAGSRRSVDLVDQRLGHPRRVAGGLLPASRQARGVHVVSGSIKSCFSLHLGPCAGKPTAYGAKSLVFLQRPRHIGGHERSLPGRVTPGQHDRRLHRRRHRGARRPRAGAPAARACSSAAPTSARCTIWSPSCSTTRWTRRSPATPAGSRSGSRPTARSRCATTAAASRSIRIPSSPTARRSR